MMITQFYILMTQLSLELELQEQLLLTMMTKRKKVKKVVKLQKNLLLKNNSSESFLNNIKTPIYSEFFYILKSYGRIIFKRIFYAQSTDGSSICIRKR